MYAKLSCRDLNLGYCLAHPTKTYTCRMITIPRGPGGLRNFHNLM